MNLWLSQHLPTIGGKNYFFLRTLPDGRRQVGWRLWVLIFVLPAVIFAGALWLAFIEMVFLDRAKSTQGEVVRVYDYESWDPWHGDATFYSPVFRYEFSDGSMTEASLGEASPAFNFAVGSSHEILFDSTRKTDLQLNDFWFHWLLPLVIAAVGVVMFLPSLGGAWLLLRWQRAGTVAKGNMGGVK